MEIRRTVVVFLFFLALAVVFTAPISLAPHERVANDGDPLHISWILAWDAHQLIRDPVHLFDYSRGRRPRRTTVDGPRRSRVTPLHDANEVYSRRCRTYDE